MRKYIVWGCLLISGCSFKTSPTLKAINYSSVSEFVLEDLEIHENSAHINIIFYKNVRIFETREFIRGDTMAKTVYHIIKDSLPTGIYYVEKDLKPKTFISVDFLEKINLGRENMNAFSHDFGEVIKIDILPLEPGKIIYRHLVARDDGTGDDSIYNYFDKKLLTFPFSLSPRLDKKLKSKLYRHELVMNPKTKLYNGKMYEIPKLRWRYEWKPISIDDKEKYLVLYDRFRKDQKNIDFQ